MTTSTSEVQEPAEKKGLLGLRIPQLLSGALAAMTTALAASRLGVSGTIVGAAMGSVLSAVGGAFYTRSLDRAQQGVVVTRERLTARIPRRDGDASETVVEQTTIEPVAAADPTLTGEGTPQGEETDRGEQPAPGEKPPMWRGWKPWAIAAVVLFVAVMLTITLLEAFLGHPISNSSEQGTTVTRVWGGGAASEPTPGPSVDPTATPTGETSLQPSADVSSSPGESVPTEPSPSDTVTEQPPAPSPTTEPVPADGGVAPSAG